jgi:hypothetical protein
LAFLAIDLENKSHDCMVVRFTITFESRAPQFIPAKPLNGNLNLKHEKYFNMVSAKAHSSTKHVLSHLGD